VVFQAYRRRLRHLTFPAFPARDLPKRYMDPRRVCTACYLELVGRSAIVGWRDDDLGTEQPGYDES